MEASYPAMKLNRKKNPADTGAIHILPCTEPAVAFPESNCLY
jgi:hypothetical protein